MIRVLPTLATRRLVLRPLEAGDAAAIHGMLSDPRVMRFWSTPPHRHLDETHAWIATSLAAMADGKAHDFAVIHEGRLIGRVAFWMGDETGFFFDPAWQGRGFAGEALGALFGYGFMQLGFGAVRADVDPDNAACLRLLGRLGFRRTGEAKNTFQIGGKWFDSVYLRLERPAPAG